MLPIGAGAPLGCWSRTIIRRSMPRPGRSEDGDYFFQPVQQFPQRQGGHDVTVAGVSFFGNEASGPVLRVDGPPGVVLDKALLPDDLIKRQTHRSFPCLTRIDPLRPCPVRVSTGHGTGKLPSSA
jgi:hypothetical protein